MYISPNQYQMLVYKSEIWPKNYLPHTKSDCIGFRITSQIAFRRRTDVGCWSQGRQILPTLGRRWADVGLPTTTRVRFLNILPTLGQRRIFVQDGGEQ